MRAPFYRFIAILLLVIPGLTATYGFLAMKDAFFRSIRYGRPHAMGKIYPRACSYFS